MRCRYFCRERIFTVAVVSTNRLASSKSCELSAAVDGCKECLVIELNALMACTTAPFLYLRGHRSGEMLRWHRFELISLRFGRYGLWRDCCWASGPIVYLYYRYLLMIGVLDFLLQLISLAVFLSSFRLYNSLRAPARCLHTGWQPSVG